MNNNNLEHLILETIKSSGKKWLRRRQLYNMISSKKLDYEKFKVTLTSMEKNGIIVRKKGRHFAIPERGGLFTGVYTNTKNSGGRIKTDDGNTVYIMPRNTGGALTGDTVQAKMFKNRKFGLTRTAKVISILKRTTRPIVGIFKIVGKTSYVIPQDKDFKDNLIVINDSEITPSDGEIVVAKAESPSQGFSIPMCIITEILGKPGDPGVDVLAIAKKYELPILFPEDVITETANISAHLTPEIIRKRNDLRSLVTFTIDPVDAKDFDDAISISKTEDGNFCIGVHIADVSHYVIEDSSLDREAQIRGMSCYFVDRVIPMLPEKLSNDLCCLKPDEDRLTKSVFAIIGPDGRIISHEIANTVIRSRMRLNYQQVQAYLEGNESNGADDITSEVGDTLSTLSELTDILIKRREERGALDFENPEARVILDNVGKPLDIVKCEHLKSHDMIEEMMILANTVVAKTLSSSSVPFLYRIHEKPETEKFESFAETAKTLGYDFQISRAETQIYIQSFLKSLKGKKHERLLNLLLLKSMKRAVYSPKKCQHYGLALPVYTHFTSPIRRYPDLLAHRQLDTFVLGKSTCSNDHNMLYYENLGNAITKREITCDSAERESIKMKTAEFMKMHIGEEFAGTVSGVIPNGFFVELDTCFVEGFVHVSTLYDDYYEKDRTGVMLIGRRGGKRFMIGDRVCVVVTAADKIRGKVDFMLVKRLGKN